MSNCIQWEEKLSALFDDALTEQERSETLAHLAVCERCRDHLAAMAAISSALGDCSETELPAGFHRQLMDSVREDNTNSIDVASVRQTPPKHSFWRRRSVLTLASCAAVLLLTVSTIYLPIKRAAVGSDAAAPMESIMGVENDLLQLEKGKYFQTAPAADEKYADESFESFNETITYDMTTDDAEPSTVYTEQNRAEEESADVGGAVAATGGVSAAQDTLHIYGECEGELLVYLSTNAVREAEYYTMDTQHLAGLYALLDAEKIVYTAAGQMGDSVVVYCLP